MPRIAECSVDTLRPSAAEFTPDESERSPLVAVSFAMAVTGCLIATAVPGTTSELLWPLLFLSFAIEEEVRTFDVPIWWSACFLIARLEFLGFTAGAPEVLQAVAGAVVAAGLFLPLYRADLLRRGTWIAVASFGAIVGIKTLPWLLLLCFLLAAPFAAIRVLRGANPGRLPLFAAIGFATAALPFLGLI